MVISMKMMIFIVEGIRRWLCDPRITQITRIYFLDRINMKKNDKYYAFFNTDLADRPPKIIPNKAPAQFVIQYSASKTVTG